MPAGRSTAVIATARLNTSNTSRDRNDADDNTSVIDLTSFNNSPQLNCFDNSNMQPEVAASIVTLHNFRAAAQKCGASTPKYNSTADLPAKETKRNKYDYDVVALPRDIIVTVPDFLHNLPSTNNCTEFKKALIETHSLNEGQK
uniref:Uncharacterized protein n=1 Tax=Glossina palpalis gambiensis TaxID=67801 RepID=A0A1B0C6M1_9MUSC